MVFSVVPLGVFHGSYFLLPMQMIFLLLKGEEGMGAGQGGRREGILQV